MFNEQDKQNLIACIDLAIKHEGLKGASVLLALAQKVQELKIE
jgi:hypothetical protein